MESNSGFVRQALFDWKRGDLVAFNHKNSMACWGKEESPLWIFHNIQNAHVNLVHGRIWEYDLQKIASVVFDDAATTARHKANAIKRWDTLKRLPLSALTITMEVFLSWDQNKQMLLKDHHYEVT